MRLLLSWLLLAACGVFAVAGDATSGEFTSLLPHLILIIKCQTHADNLLHRSTAITDCSTWMTASATTWLAEIVIENIDPSSAVTDWTTRVFSGAITTYAFTEPIVTDATSITVVSTIPMLMAAYDYETIIQCGTSLTTIPGPTSTSLVATVTASSIHGNGSSTAVMSGSGASAHISSVVSTETQRSLTSMTGITSTFATMVSSSNAASLSETRTSTLSSASADTAMGTWSESVGSTSSSSIGIWGPSSSSTSADISDWANYTPSTIAATPSLLADATVVSPTGFLTSTTSSAPASTATSNTTAPVVVPLYTAKFDNVTYYIPSCSDPEQTLWRSDGSNFTLSCNNITLPSGDVIPVPEDPPQGTCQTTTVNGSSACFSRRFDWYGSDGSFTCQYTSDSKRDTGSIYANLTAIADALALVKDVTSAASSAEQGLANVGCAAQQAFEAVSAYYFNGESTLSKVCMKSAGAVEY